MRYAGWFYTVLLASLAVGGCDSGKVAARKKLAEQVGKARRLYLRATSHLANPHYVDAVTKAGVARDEVVVLKDGSRITGRVTPTPTGYRIETRTGQARQVALDRVAGFEVFKTDAADISVTTQPTDSAPAEQLLDKASQLVMQALADNADAPAGAKADARQVLGDIESARGGLLAAAAERLRQQAAERRGHARALAGAAQNHADLAKFNESLANAPRVKVLAAQAAAQKELAAANGEIKTLDGKIVALQKQMATLRAENADLTKKARSLRDASERGSGQKSLDLLKQAHEHERTKNRKTAQIDQAKDQIDSLLVDKGFQQGKSAAAQARVDLLKGRLAGMDGQKKVSEDAMQAARADADRTFKQVQGLGGEVVQACKTASAKEAAALEAFKQAADRFREAAQHIRDERDAARKAQPDEPLAGSEITRQLADDKHLAGIMAARAAASLASAELRSRQLGTAKGNADLAGAMAAAAKQLGQQAPATVAELKAYLADEAQTRDQAIREYQAAEKELESVLSSHLRDRIGERIRWIYQGLLADAYLGHYRLTNDPKVLTQAKSLIDKAVEGKAGSPFVTPARQLKALIDAAGE